MGNCTKNVNMQTCTHSCVQTHVYRQTHTHTPTHTCGHTHEDTYTDICLSPRYPLPVGYPGGRRQSVKRQTYLNFQQQFQPNNVHENKLKQFVIQVTVTLSHSHSNTLTHTLSLTHSHSHTLTPTLSLTHLHSHTLTRTLSLSHWIFPQKTSLRQSNVEEKFSGEISSD